MKDEQLKSILLGLTREIRDLKKAITETHVAFGIWVKEQDEHKQDVQQQIARQEERIDRHAGRINEIEQKLTAAQ